MRRKTQSRLVAKTFGPVRPEKNGDQVRKPLDRVGERKTRAKAFEFSGETSGLPASAKDRIAKKVVAEFRTKRLAFVLSDGDGDFGSVDGRGRAAHQTVEFVLGNEGEALARLGKAPVVVPSLLLGSRTLGRQGAKVRVTGDQIRPVDVRRFVFGEFFSKTHARRRRSRPAAVERDDAGEKRGILFEKLAVEVPFKGRRRRHGNSFALRGALYSRPPSRALAAALGAAFSAFVRR